MPATRNPKLLRDTPHCTGLIGDPVAHSLSPVIHTAAFRAQKLHYVYLPLQVKVSDLKRALLALRMTDIEGCNVTTPHKQAIMKFLDRLDASARQAGAVNTIYRRDGKWIGANTDGSGFLAACERRKVRLRGKTVLVLGSGGAAAGIAAALAGAGIRQLTLLNRSAARAQTLRRQLRRHFKMAIDISPLSAASYRRLFPEADILIHATSAGMNGTPLVLPIHLLPRQAIVCDCQYRPDRATPLMIQAHRSRHRTIDGLDLLLGQAAESYRLWMGHRPAIEAMRRAVAKKHPFR